MDKPVRRWIGFWVALAALAVVVRILVGGWVECRRAGAELDAGRPYQAVLHHERAVRWYMPGSPYVGRAADALWETGEQAEAAGDPELALFAFRGLRASAYATRSFYQPMPRRIADCEERIAALMEADPAATWPDRALSDEQRREIILDNLRSHEDPHTGWVIALEIGLITWLTGAALLSWRVGRRGKTRRGTVLLVGASVAGYLLWLLGMWRA